MEDKAHRWVISDGSLEPTLIARAGREEEGEGDGADKMNTEKGPAGECVWLLLLL